MPTAEAKMEKWDAKRIRELRSALRKSQTEMAEMVGVSQGTWWCWEAGRYPPRKPYVILLNQLCDRIALRS